MKLLHSFGYAFRGIAACVRLERNFRIHIIAVITVLIVSHLYDLPLNQYPPILLIMALVLGLEAFNTALEQTVNLATSEQTPKAQIAKDAAAAGVLIAALYAVAIAATTFSDAEKWRTIFTYFQSPPAILALIVYVLLSWTFVFQWKTKEENL